MTAPSLLDQPRSRLQGKRGAHLCHAVCLPDEKIGFRYENPILILKDKCEAMSKFGLRVEVIE
jgi:hypothetical protein